jgi:L,D-transpeptidase catalytic domain
MVAERSSFYGMMQSRARVQRALVATGIVVTAVVVTVMATALAGVLRRNPRPDLALQGTVTRAQKLPSVPPPVRPAFVPRTLHPLSAKSRMSRWAPVRTATVARAQPRPSSPVVAHLATHTPEGTVNITSVISTRTGSDGRLWVHVHLPILPNGRTGWVRRGDLGGYGFVATRLVVDLSSFKAVLYRGRRAIFHAPIGVGKASSPTPRGKFYVRDKVLNFNNPFYGPVAFGTSARSDSLTDWPGGGFIGIHGTNEPGLIPGRISHGCIRMRNKDITRLAGLMPTGTPVVIR